MIISREERRQRIANLFENMNDEAIVRFMYYDAACSCCPMDGYCNNRDVAPKCRDIVQAYLSGELSDEMIREGVRE